VSLVACYVGTDSLVDYDDVRGPVAGALNNACRRAAGKSITRPTAFDDAVAALPVVDNVVATWSRLTDLRNDLAHVGMNDAPQSAARLGRAMEALYPALDELASVLLTNDNEDRR
jgi:hypothetical protein